MPLESVGLPALAFAAGRPARSDFAAQFVTEATYSETDPAKRAANEQAMKPGSEKAMALLGPELAPRIFGAKPPISVVIAVRNDPKFK